MHGGLSSYKYIILTVKLLVSFLFMNILVDSNIVAETSSKDHLLTNDEQLTVDEVWDNKNREQTLDQSTNLRHAQAAFNMKYTANTEERVSSLDDSSNVTIYDRPPSPIRFSRTLTRERRVPVSTPTPGNQFYPRQ